jgi:hypothetical protein
MSKLLTTVTALSVLAALSSPSHAVYTGCTVKKDTDLVNRPGGNSDPRWPTLQRGEDVAIRDVFRDWVFVTYFTKRGVVALERPDTVTSSVSCDELTG